MTREEYNEFRYIRSSLKKFTLGHGTTVTVRTDAGADYKHRLDDLYTSLNFHPASIRRDPRMYDDKERIIYIFGRTWTDKSTSKAWYFGKLKDNMTENGVAEVSYENEIPTFTYKAEVQVTGYFNDNYSVVNLCRMYKNKDIANIGFWRIGFEDPDFWNWIEINK